MATKLDDLKFNDYTLKGTPNGGGGMSFSLGVNDTIGVQDGTILSYSSEYGGWYLDGYAKYATDGIPGVLEADGQGNWTFSGTADYVTHGIPGVLETNGQGNWTFSGTADYAKYVTDGIPGVLVNGSGSWTFNGTADYCGSIPGVLYDGGSASYELHVSYAYIDVISLSGQFYTLSVDNGFVKATAINNP